MAFGFNAIPSHLTLHCAVYAEMRALNSCFLINKFTIVHLIFLIVKCYYNPLVTWQSNRKQGLRYGIV
jgi:hypothetical protein